jgi:hypothetical protein
MRNFASMRAPKHIFDLYLEGSIHVALSVFAMVQVTGIRLGIPFSPAVSGFAFFGTIVGYNFVKYDALARHGRPQWSIKLKFLVALSAVGFVAALYFFVQLERLTKIISVAVFLVTALYTLSFFPNQKSARNWAGLKIYFVAVSWVGVTVALPVFNAGADIGLDFYITCLQRFIVVVVLLFVFEIIDLAWDDPHLLTVPQQIGVRRTKILGILLLVVCLVLELLKHHRNIDLFWCNIGMVIVTSVFLIFANERRPRYYTTFWVESIPVLWWLALEMVH